MQLNVTSQAFSTTKERLREHFPASNTRNHVNSHPESNAVSEFATLRTCKIFRILASVTCLMLFRFGINQANAAAFRNPPAALLSCWRIMIIHSAFPCTCPLSQLMPHTFRPNFSITFTSKWGVTRRIQNISPPRRLCIDFFHTQCAFYT